MTASIDVDQLAALRALRRGFGDVRVLEVVDRDSGGIKHHGGEPGRDPAPVQASQSVLFEEVTPGQP